MNEKSPLPNITIGIGLVLVVLGLIAYGVSESKSLTALIPSILGLILAVLGWLGRQQSMRKHAMHGVALVALLGFLGSMRVFGGLSALLSGEEGVSGLAVSVQFITLLLCLALLVFSVKSFLNARRSRTV